METDTETRLSHKLQNPESPKLEGTGGFVLGLWKALRVHVCMLVAVGGQPPQLSLGHRALQFERGSLIWEPKSSPCWLLASLGSASSHGHEEHASLHLKTKLQTWVPGRTEAQALMTESTPYLPADTFSSGSEPEGSEP